MRFIPSHPGVGVSINHYYPGMKVSLNGLILCKNLRVFIYLLFSCFSLCIFSQEQTKNFESLNVSNGLVQSLVTDILSDRYGYMWFGTYNGLSRYDGYEFVNFHYDPIDTNTLTHSTIWELFEGENGDIWIGTSSGLSKYDRSKEQFIRYENESFSEINIINQWSSDTLILETSNGIWFFNSINGNFSQKEEFSIYKHVSGIGFNHNNELVLTDEEFIYLIREKETKKLKIGNSKILYVDSGNNIWVVTYTDIRRISADFSDMDIFPAGTSASFLAKIAEDQHGNVLVANEKLYVFNSIGDLTEIHAHDPKRMLSLDANAAISVAVDERDNWWVGTSGYGVNKYDPNRFYINYLGYNPSSASSLSNSYITSFYSKDDKKIFIGTATSLDMYNVETASIENIYPRRIDQLIEVNGQLWGASTDRLVIIDRENEKVINEICIGEISGPVRAMKADKDGTLWVASNNGLSKLNLSKTSDFQSFILENLPKNSSDWFTSIYLKDDEMIIGSTSGLLRMNMDSLIIQKMEDPIFDPLDGSFIKSITEDSNGIIWLGTDSEGLFRWDRKENRLEHFTRNDGLPSNVVYGVLQDSQGFLWMSTNYGLARFDDKTKKFLNLDIGYGLQSNEFNTGAYFKSANGMLYFGGVEGLNYFKPNLIENQVEPDTEITGFYIRNERRSPADLGKHGAIMDVDTLILDYKQNMLSFDFTSSNLTISKLNQYAYYMEGLEDDWNYVGNRRFANYSALQPGSYVFNVKSANNSDLWDTTPAQMVILITEPFWQTTWFRFFLITFLIALIILIAGLRIRGLKRAKARLNELVLERTKNLQLANEDLKKTMEEKEEAKQKLIQSEKMAALGVLSAGVGHEINNPLNFINQGIIGLEKELSKDGKGDPQKINKFSSIIHEGVHRASQIVKGLSSFSRTSTAFDENCEIESIIDNCILLLNSKLEGRIEIDKSYSTKNQSVKGNGGKLHQLFFNVLSNAQQAINKKGTITISTAVIEDMIQVIIADTGNGITRTNLSKIFDPFFTTKDPGEGTGLGLAIALTIAKEHKGHIHVSSTVSKGSTFEIKLPIKKVK